MLVEGKIFTDKWYTFPAISAIDFITGLTGKVYSDFTCFYYYGGDEAVSEVTLTADHIKEAGLGGYSIRLGLYEFIAVGNVEIIIKCSGMVDYRLPIQVKTNDNEVVNNQIIAGVDANVVSIETSVLNEITDADLIRDWTEITGEPDYCKLQALRFLRNKWFVEAETNILNVMKEDGVTVAWTSDLSTSDTADPITGSTPI